MSGSIGLRQFEKLPDHREIWVHRLKTSRQRIFQRDVILQLSRIDPIGHENLIAEFEWRIDRAGPFCVGQISHDALDAKSAIDAIGIDFIRRILRLQ